jgi:hypothetical protein
VIIQLLVDQQLAVGKEESSDHEEQQGNSDSGYSGSQPSEWESSDNCVAFAMDNDFFQTFSEEYSEVRENNRSNQKELCKETRHSQGT